MTRRRAREAEQVERAAAQFNQINNKLRL